MGSPQRYPRHSCTRLAGLCAVVVWASGASCGPAPDPEMLDGGARDPDPVCDAACTPEPSALGRACDLLVDRTCGAAPDGGAAPCSDEPGCVAAELTRRHQPDTCVDRLNEVKRYPGCTVGGTRGLLYCEQLVVRCCGVAPASDAGGGGRCSGGAGCHNARAVAQSGTDEECRQAQGDDVAFPRCQER